MTKFKIYHVGVSLGLLLSIIASSVLVLSLDDTSAETQLQDILLIKSSLENSDKSLKITAKGERYFKELDGPLRIVSMVGNPEEATFKLMKSLFNRPTETIGPSAFGVEFWPETINITLPQEAKLVGLHYDHIVYKPDEVLVEAKLIAIMTLASNYIVYNRNREFPLHPIPMFTFLANRLIPAFILNDLVEEKRKDLDPMLNWPKIRLHCVSLDDIFEDSFHEYQFPGWKWPSIEEMYKTGQYGGRDEKIEEFVDLLKKEEQTLFQLKSEGMVPVRKMNVNYSNGPEKLSLIKGLIELVDSQEFADRHRAKMIELKELVEKYTKMYEKRAEEKKAKEKEEIIIPVDETNHDEL